MLAVLAAGPALSVEYALTYISVPGQIDYVRTNVGVAPAVDSPQSDLASFGAFGFVAVVPIPGLVGPFAPAVEAGFALPAGDQAFDHRNLALNASSHNGRHDGDFTTWNVTAVPILVAVRYSRASENVTFGGEVGLGVFFLGVTTDRTLTTYNAADTTIIEHVTSSRQDVALTPAVQALAGLVVPASEGVDLRLYGGLIWLADVARTTTSDSANPVLIYGDAKDLPGLTIGGLGFTLRLALNVNL